MGIKNKADGIKAEHDDSLSILQNLSYKDVEAKIDDVFGNLTTKQKNFLKKLVKLILWLYKEK